MEWPAACVVYAGSAPNPRAAKAAHGGAGHERTYHTRRVRHAYMTRPPITPERMLGEPGSAQVIYRSDAVHPRHQANFRVFDPLDFLAEVSAHIPDAHEKSTLFYGWYSNRTRGYRRQHGLLGKAEAAEPVPSEGTRAPLEVRRSWARLIRLACCS